MAKAAPKQNELNIDLLPTGEEKSSTGLIHWVLTVGRYLIIFTEVVALSTFVFGILLSKEKNDLKTSITSQAAEVENLQTCDKNDPSSFCEPRFRQIQSQLNLISQTRNTQNQDNLVLTELLKLLPSTIHLESLTLEKNNLSFSGRLNPDKSSNAPVENQLQTLIINFNNSTLINNLDISNLTKDSNLNLKFEATAVVNRTEINKEQVSGGSQ